MDPSRADLTLPQLVAELVAIFPGFAAEWEADCAGEIVPSTSLHSVYQSFLPFVSGQDADDGQWHLLAAILNREVAAGGVRENAVATCFLEHCGQVGIVRRLRPLLDRAARARLRA